MTPRDPRAVVAFSDSEGFGGTEKALGMLLSGLVDHGWRPMLLHHGGEGLAPLLDSLSEHGIPDRVVPRMPEGPRGAVAAARFARELGRLRPAVFHAHLTWPFSCAWALAAARVARLSAVVGTAQLYMEVRVGPWRRAEVWVLGRCVDRMIAVSDHTQRMFVTMGWPAHGWAVIPNAVAVERFARRPHPSVRTALEDGSGRAIAVVPARLDVQKGHEDLLEAAQHLPDVRLLCVGEGDLRTALEDRARILGIEDRVVFLGFRTDIDGILGSCDLVVLPSLYEGFPLSLIEAMAAGKPVVATDIGGTRELVVDGVTGLLVPPRAPRKLAEAVKKILGDRALANRLGEAGKERAEQHFGSRAMVGAVLGEYEALLSGTPGSKPSARA
jgi:glycosyltransferase involved in cell wall biosynthesis